MGRNVFAIESVSGELLGTARRTRKLVSDLMQVIQGRCRDQAAADGVGAVEENLVVDPLVVAGGGVGHIDEPAPF